MTAREQLIAYLATLVILLLVLIAALIAAAVAPQVAGKMEVFGLGTITGGLIGVLRIPSQQQPRATASTENGDVNVVPPENKS
jgi:hypothetical protein